MRLLYLALIMIFGVTTASAQEEIFQIVEQMPRFPGCEDQDLSGSALQECAQQKMLEFIYENVRYPEAARRDSTKGTVVIRFVIRKDGSVDDAKIAREIGSGCGEEALRVVQLMKERDIRWIPGYQKGEAVDVYFNLPVKYKLQDAPPPPPPPLPYFIVGQDTIYTDYDEAPVYGTQPNELTTYMESLPYPKGVDSCVAGSFAVQFFISKEGIVKIGDMYDYSNLGFDFQFEAVNHLNATNQKWQAARRNGAPVSAYLPLRLTFKPQEAGCQEVADKLDQAYEKAAVAEDFYANNQIAEAIDQWSAALELMPGNTEFLLLRGQAYLEVGEKDKACSDLQLAKKVVPLADWVNRMLPLICAKTTTEE